MTNGLDGGKGNIMKHLTLWLIKVRLATIEAPKLDERGLSQST